MKSPVTLVASVAARTALLYGLLLGFSSGCQTYTTVARERVSVEQVVSLTKQGKTPEEIINLIYDSRTVYHLHARDIKNLIDQGVDEKVVDFMMETQIKDLERYYRAYYSWYPYQSYWGPHFGFGYYYYP
ncbi:MAG: hypothetical protein HY717_19200 [Planctomycetes bacterium]|nr:hypothetical protein [Planctomycetota bacterium]